MRARDPWVVKAVATHNSEGELDWLLHIRTSDGKIQQESQEVLCQEEPPAWLHEFWDAAVITSNEYSIGQTVTRRQSQSSERHSKSSTGSRVTGSDADENLDAETDANISMNGYSRPQSPEDSAPANDIFNQFLPASWKPLLGKKIAGPRAPTIAVHAVSPSIDDEERDELFSDGDSGSDEPSPPVVPPFPEHARKKTWRSDSHSPLPEATSSSKRKEPSSPSEFDFPPPPAKRNTREAKARRERQSDYVGHLLFDKAFQVPAPPTNADGFPVAPERHSPVPIAAKARFFSGSNLQVISPGISISQQSSVRSVSNDQQRRPITRLEYHKEAGGLVSVSGSRISRSVLPEEESNVTEEAFDRDFSLGDFVEDDLGTAQPGLSNRGMVAPPEDEEDLLDYEDATDEVEAEGDQSTPPVPPRDPTPPSFSLALAPGARFKLESPAPTNPNQIGLQAGVFKVPLTYTGFAERERFRMNLKLPLSIISKCLGDPDIKPANLPVFRIRFTDFSVTPDSARELNGVLRDFAEINLMDAQLRDDQELYRSESMRQDWMIGAGMSARVRVIDGMHHDASRSLLQEATNRLYMENMYISYPTVTQGVQLVFFPASDKCLCDTLLVPRQLRGPSEELLVCWLRLP